MAATASRRAAPRPADKGDTSERILDIAERLVQTRGYNAFSYADIAESLQITKASLHYHFPSKTDLGTRLIERYVHNFGQALIDIDETSATVAEKLHRYVALYAEVVRDDRLCLCGMLAAEVATLPEPMRVELKRFFEENEHWLEAALMEGLATRTLRFNGSVRDMAQLIIGSLEGAMILARSYDDPRRFDATADRLLAALGINR